MDAVRTFERTDADFVSQGTRCAAWAYRPEGEGLPPVIIMAHGFAGERAFGLPAFAEAFAAQGFAVLLFDYRTFGDSDGTPRDNVDPFDHGKDWDAAIAHARTLERLDTSRIILWGTSYSGAHVICAAARDSAIAATISQVPYSGIPADAPKPPFLTLIGMIANGLRDKVQTALTGKPHYLPVVGPPGSRAMLNTPECEPGYQALIPAGKTFANRMPYKLFLIAANYSPIEAAKVLTCPALVVAGEHDSLIPVEQAKLMAGLLGKGEFVTLDCDHFSPYRGQWFDKNIALQMDFLMRHVAP